MTEENPRSRLLPLLVGLALLLTTGLVHGLWTDRWQPSEKVARGAERLKGLPDEVGSWRGEAFDQDPEEMKMTGAMGHWSRLFTDSRSGEKVMVILLCGRPKQMSVHRPEDCYLAAGYTMPAPARRLMIDVKNGPTAAFWTGIFSRDEAEGPSRTRIFWSWCAPGAAAPWIAADSPRIAFARQQVLYKMYVIRTMTASTPAAADPCVRLLDQLLPILNAALPPN